MPAVNIQCKCVAIVAVYEFLDAHCTVMTAAQCHGNAEFDKVDLSTVLSQLLVVQIQCDK